MSATREHQLAVVRRSRLLRRVAPVSAVAVAGVAYGLHHTTLLAGHGLGVILVVVSAAATVALAPFAVAQSAERQLPVIITLGRGSSEICAVEKDELDFCAALHAEKLPHGFFAELGHRFLRAYLETFVASPHAVALLVKSHGAPVGMVVGVLRPASHARWVLRRRGLRLALLGGLALATRPRLALRFVRTRLARYRRAFGRRGSLPTTMETGQPAVLSHVAVTPGAEGAHLGTQLVQAFVAAARDAGCSSIVLVTLAGENGAVGFYRRLGWVESSPHRNFDGQPMIAFSLQLSPKQ